MIKAISRSWTCATHEASSVGYLKIIKIFMECLCMSGQMEVPCALSLRQSNRGDGGWLWSEQMCTKACKCASHPQLYSLNTLRVYMIESGSTMTMNKLLLKMNKHCNFTAQTTWKILLHKKQQPILISFNSPKALTQVSSWCVLKRWRLTL